MYPFSSSFGIASHVILIDLVLFKSCFLTFGGGTPGAIKMNEKLTLKLYGPNQNGTECICYSTWL